MASLTSSSVLHRAVLPIAWWPTATLNCLLTQRPIRDHLVRRFMILETLGREPAVAPKAEMSSLGQPAR